MIKVNIYSPTYHRFEKTKLAVSSIIDTVNSSKYDVRYYICDNNSPKEMKEWIAEQDDNNEKVTSFFCDKNWGKAKVVNFVHENERDCDFVISIDSDMLNVHSEYNWIDEMVDIMNNVPELGVLSSFQEGSNCHNMPSLWKSFDVNFPNKKHTVIYGNGGGVAGGCIIMRTSEFNAMGGYTVKDVYNADDAMIMIKVSQGLKKVCGVSKTVALEHMVNDPEEKDYQAWKIAKSRGEIENGEGTKGFFDK